VSENLAIKTDRVADWRKRKQQSVERDLTPRTADHGLKSSWAHCEEPLTIISDDILDNHRLAPCELQALALFIFDQRNPASPRRNKILGVSIQRAALRSELVIEDAADHPIKNYSSTHRSLLLSDQASRAEVIAKIFSDDLFKGWVFTREMMAELLEQLLDGGHIVPEFQRDARSLLLEWQS
jgi:hypothetical protein